jgi:electron transfer flavoprotein alpha subunit
MLARFAARSAHSRLFSSRSLIIADHDNSKLLESTLSVVTAAGKIGGDVTVLVAGSGCGAVAKQAAGIAGVHQVLCADHAAFSHAQAENLAALVHKHASGFTHVLTSSSSTGKSFLPRAAVLSDASPVTDVVRKSFFSRVASPESCRMQCVPCHLNIFLV